MTAPQKLVARTDRRALSQIVINLANNAIKFTERGSVRLRAERREEIIAQVTVFKRRVGNITKKHAVDVGEKQISGVAHDPDIILDVQCKLEIIAPVAALVSVVRQNGIVEENPKAVKVGAQPIKHDDVRRDDQKIAGER